MNKQLNKIMYIEDEADISAIAKIALEDIGGIKTLCCSSGKEALEKVKDYQPDLFLIDVMMPEMDGPSLLKALRNLPEFKSSPIIFMTAKTQTKEIKEYLAMGALNVITKPFDPMTLAQTIKDIWEKQ